MFHSQQSKLVRIIGVALAGSEGSPVVVFQDPDSKDFLSLALSPFDAETVIRDHIGEGEDTAVAWLAEVLRRNPPRKAYIVKPDAESFQIRFVFGGFASPKDRVLAVGEALAVARRLNVPVYADEALFAETADELRYLSESRSFSGDFLYLTPTRYAPTIPVI